MKNLKDIEFPGKMDTPKKKVYKKGYKTLKHGNVKEGYSKLKNVKMFEAFHYDATINEGIDTSDDSIRQKYYNELVGPSGAADTKEGEMLRAINKIGYRYLNDGDYFYEEYGVETAGSSYIYLTEHSPLAEQLADILGEAVGKKNGTYEDILQKAIDAITGHITSKNGNHEKNDTDNLDYYDDAMEKFGHNVH